MTSDSNKIIKAMVIHLIILCGTLTCMGCSSGLEWVVGVGSISAEQLQRSLQAGKEFQFLDVGPRQFYLEGHLPGARWVDYKKLEEQLPRLSLDRTKPLVITCPSGYLSVPAAAVAKGQGFGNVVSLHGGVAQWRNQAFVLQAGATDGAAGSENFSPVLVPMSRIQQLAATISGLGFKPTYMALTLALILGLWGNKSRDVALIRGGLIAFLVGESFCALNYLIFSGASDSFDALHGLGMVFMGALVSWGLVVLLDERVLSVTAPARACAFKRLCGACWKYQNVSCRLQRLLLLAIPALAITALMPWCTPLRVLHQESMVFATPVLYSYSINLQLADFRLYSFLAAAFFFVAWARTFKGVAFLKSAQLPFFTAMGLMSFSLFRFFLLEAFRLSPAWMDFWEEATELFLIVGLGWFLYLNRMEMKFWFRAEQPQSKLVAGQKENES